MPYSDPTAGKAYRAAYYLKHKVKINAYNKAHYAANKEQFKALARAKHNKAKDDPAYKARRLAARRRQDKLPEPTREAPDACECCSRLPGMKALSLDHCHETGIFRGWLCNACNLAIGMLGDNLAGIMMAAKYLSESWTNTNESTRMSTTVTGAIAQ